MSRNSYNGMRRQAGQTGYFLAVEAPYPRISPESLMTLEEFMKNRRERENLRPEVVEVAISQQVELDLPSTNEAVL